MKRFLLWILTIAIGLVALFAGVPLAIALLFKLGASAFEAQTPMDPHVVAVLEVNHEILDLSHVVKELYKQARNDEVKGIVLRVDSPGGAVGPSQELYAAVKKLKAVKPIVASMGGVAASGGLYVTLGASKVFAQPGTLTGSIGVILQVPNFKKVTDLIGVDVITVKSGQLKDLGNPFREMTEGDRAFLQGMIESAWKNFVNDVVAGRGIDAEKVRTFADGRIILGTQAKELGLVDSFGDVEDAARAVFELRGEPLAENVHPKLFYPGHKYEFLREIVDAASAVPRLIGSRRMELKYLLG